MDGRIEQFLRDTAASLSCDRLTNAPFQMSELRVEKVGFAEIPIVFVMVACPKTAVRIMVPIVRQFVFRELEAAGIENEIIEFTPTVEDMGRPCTFINYNEHSPSKGKRKRGRLYRYTFEIKPPFLGFFVWNKHEGRIPERGNA